MGKLISTCEISEQGFSSNEYKIVHSRFANFSKPQHYKIDRHERMYLRTFLRDFTERQRILPLSGSYFI